MRLAVLSEFLEAFHGYDTAHALKVLNGNLSGAGIDETAAMLRMAIHRPLQPMMTVFQTLNIWKKLGKPSLKPFDVHCRLVLLSDANVDGLVPLVELFCAAYGITVRASPTDFDSVEQTVLDPDSILYAAHPDITVLLLSDRWLQRHFGSASLIDADAVESAVECVDKLVDTIRSGWEGEMLVGTIPGRPHSPPAGLVTFNGAMGWDLALLRFNLGIAESLAGRARLVNLGVAVTIAGGAAVLGRDNFLRARAPLEPPGTQAVAREIASAIASVYGKTHRALVTDWDNTLWGGEVAEAGSHGLVCGQETPEGLGYYLLQEYLKNLRPLGILLAGVSRNDPGVARVLEDNTELVLSADDFASLRIGFGPKSDAVEQVSKDLGFGPEFMVFVDDDLFEIAEVMSAHPAIDVVKAGVDPLATLSSLSEARFFNAVFLSEDDVERGGRVESLQKQRKTSSTFSNIDDFLRRIDIHVCVAHLNEKNVTRVEQMFQKTNQFNLTTRRHRLKDLRDIVERGGKVLVFSYEDSFGSQGIVASVVLVHESETWHIESLLMSCRVLNRTVEQAVMDYVFRNCPGKKIVGEYRPTNKNAMVRDYYENLGFTRETGGDDEDSTFWVFDPKTCQPVEMKHFVVLLDG